MAVSIKAFFDEVTFTVSYVVTDGATNNCAIIDPVLGYDPVSGRTDTEPSDEIISYVEARGLTVEWILETHVHADHVTSSPYLQSKLGGKIGIGVHVSEVQAHFAGVFNVEEGFVPDGRQFDALFNDGDTISIGETVCQIMHTPGHTPACVSYIIEDTVFVGDTMFMPDYGTARTDFPGGDAKELYQSIKSILSLPPETRLFMCHDYKAPGRDDYAWETSVLAQKDNNIHIHDGVTEEEFVEFRTTRDKELNAPQLILPSLQVNIRAGNFPPAEGNGIAYIKIPLNVL